MKKEEHSKNERAEMLCGSRGPGTPLFAPGELGYACPICGCSGDCLRWSEYKSFLWCGRCNLDIPSCLCVKFYEPKLSSKAMTQKERIAKATKLFLDCIEEAK